MVGGLFQLICYDGKQDQMLMGYNMFSSNQNDDTFEEFFGDENTHEKRNNRKRDRDETDEPMDGPKDLYIPLMFWFNRDPRLAIPVVSIPDINYDMLNNTSTKKRFVQDVDDTEYNFNEEGKMMRNHFDDNDAPMKRRMIAV